MIRIRLFFLNITLLTEVTNWILYKKYRTCSLFKDKESFATARTINFHSKKVLLFTEIKRLSFIMIAICFHNMK